MFARVPMDKLFPSENDDFVVVGHISMNPKKNKKKLQKIADSNSKQRTENFRTQKPQYNQAPYYNQPQSQNQYQKPQQKQQKQKQQHSKPQPKPQGITLNANAPVFVMPGSTLNANAPVFVQQHVAPRQTNVSTRPRRVETKIVIASRPPAVQNGTVMQWMALPEEIHAAIFRFSGVATIGSVAPTCQMMAKLFNASAIDMWSALAGPSMTPLCRVSLKSTPRDAFRRYLFGLEGQWLAAFSTFAETHTDAVEVLHEADYLVGGMVAVEKAYASGLVRIVLSAANRCVGLDHSEFDQAASTVATTVRKMERRTEVFAAASISEIREAGFELQEKAVLARLEDNDDAPTFDYFQDDIQDFWAEEEKDNADLDLAVSFLDLLAPLQ